MLFYRAALPLSSRTLTYLSGLIRRHRAAIGSRWRRLNPGQQAMLALVHLRKGETFSEIAAGFGVGTATAQERRHRRGCDARARGGASPALGTSRSP